MLRVFLLAMSFWTCGALCEARACTLIPSELRAGSSEAIAEERALTLRLSERIAESDVVFVGKVVAQRSANLAETIAGLNGRFTTGRTVLDRESGASRPETFVPGWRAWFEPVEVLKGTPDRPTTNILSGFYGSCDPGPNLRVGDNIIVFANMESGYWVGQTATIDLLPLARSLPK